MAQYKKSIWYIYAYDSEGDLCYLVKTRMTTGKDNRTFNTVNNVYKATNFYEPVDAENTIKGIQTGKIDLMDNMINPEELKVCYFVDDCVCDNNTDKQIDFYGSDDAVPKPSKYNESMKLHEALDILKKQGYILKLED